MEFILSALFIFGIWAFFKCKDVSATNYMNTHHIDYGKMNNDRILNDLSNSQVNQNILNGKYNAPAAANKNSNDTWEDFKKRHPHGSWN